MSCTWLNTLMWRAGWISRQPASPKKRRTHRAVPRAQSALRTPLCSGIPAQIFGRCSSGSLHDTGSVFGALPRMAFHVRCTCFVSAIFMPQKYAPMRKRGLWGCLGGSRVTETCAAVIVLPSVWKRFQGNRGFTEDRNCSEPYPRGLFLGFCCKNCYVRSWQESR